jgi:uncharacterized protein YqiB (DUF1249 family)
MRRESNVARDPSYALFVTRYSFIVRSGPNALRFIDSIVLSGESSLPASWRGRPRSFVALMSLYESNYLRLTELAGSLRNLRGECISAIESDCDLRLRVGEVSPYTTMLELTYLFGCEGDETACTAPDMQLRIYHDASLVEAHSWAATHHHPLLRDWRQLVGQDLDQRWARNVMLNKWLEYCLDRGHCLRAASAEPNCTMSPAT